MVKGFDEEAFMAFRIAATLFTAATLADLELISVASVSVGCPSSFFFAQASKNHGPKIGTKSRK